MKQWILAAMVLGSLAMAQSVPLTRYFPDYALATFEINDVQGAIEQTGGFGEETVRAMSALVGSGLEAVMEETSQQLGAGAGLNLGLRALLGSLRDFSLAVYASPAGYDEPFMLAVLRLGQHGPLGRLAQETVDQAVKATKSRFREEAYVAAGEDGMWFGMQYGLLYVSNSPDLLRGYLRRVQGGKQPVLWRGTAYRSVMGAVGSGWLRYYANLGSLGQYLNRLEPIPAKALSALRTLNLVGGAQAITTKGLQNRSMAVLNPAGGDTALYRLLTYAPHHLELPSQMLGGNAGSFVLALDMPGWLDYLKDWAAVAAALGDDFETEDLDNLHALMEQLKGYLGNEWGVSSPVAARSASYGPWLGLLGMDDTLSSDWVQETLGDLEQVVFYATVQDGPATLEAIVQGVEGQAGLSLESTELSGYPALKIAGQDLTAWLALKENRVVLSTGKATLEAALTPKDVLSNTSDFRATAYPAQPSSLSLVRPLRLSRSEIETLIDSSLKTLDISNKDLPAGARQVAINWLESFYQRLQNSHGYTVVSGHKVELYSLSGFRWNK